MRAITLITVLVCLFGLQINAQDLETSDYAPQVGAGYGGHSTSHYGGSSNYGSHGGHAGELLKNINCDPDKMSDKSTPEGKKINN